MEACSTTPENSLNLHPMAYGGSTDFSCKQQNDDALYASMVCIQHCTYVDSVVRWNVTVRWNVSVKVTHWLTRVLG